MYLTRFPSLSSLLSARKISHTIDVQAHTACIHLFTNTGHTHVSRMKFSVMFTDIRSRRASYRGRFALEEEKTARSVSRTEGAIKSFVLTFSGNNCYKREGLVAERGEVIRVDFPRPFPGSVPLISLVRTITVTVIRIISRARDTPPVQYARSMPMR